MVGDAGVPDAGEAGPPEPAKETKGEKPVAACGAKKKVALWAGGTQIPLSFDDHDARLPNPGRGSQVFGQDMWDVSLNFTNFKDFCDKLNGQFSLKSFVCGNYWSECGPFQNAGGEFYGGQKKAGKNSCYPGCRETGYGSPAPPHVFSDVSNSRPYEGQAWNDLNAYPWAVLGGTYYKSAANGNIVASGREADK